MKLYGLFVITGLAKAEVSVENDPRHHSWFSQAWTSFTDAVSDLFSGFNSEVGFEAFSSIE